MKKHLMFAGLTLASGLALAQVSTPSATPPTLPTTPTNPSIPQASGSVSGSASTNGVTGAGAASLSGDFGKLDANADGSLSRSELSSNAKLNKDFKSFDKDGNGTLSSQEYEMALKGSASKK